jgi:hypothetical protein
VFIFRSGFYKPSSLENYLGPITEGKIFYKRLAIKDFGVASVFISHAIQYESVRTRLQYILPTETSSRAQSIELGLYTVTENAKHSICKMETFELTAVAPPSEALLHTLASKPRTSRVRSDIE